MGIRGGGIYPNGYISPPTTLTPDHHAGACPVWWAAGWMWGGNLGFFKTYTSFQRRIKS